MSLLTNGTRGTTNGTRPRRRSERADRASTSSHGLLSRRAVRARRSSGGVTTAVIVLVLITAYAFFAPIALPEAGTVAHLGEARQAPGAAHWFGTDQLGHDLFARVALGLRLSIVVASICAVTSTAVGVAVGAAAATFGGRVDTALMRLADAVNALPHLLLGIVIVALFRGSLLAIVVSIVVTHWPPVARLVRSEALTVRSMEYVDAAYLGGARRRDVLRMHVLPATAAQAVVAVTLSLPHAIWHESTLSFLGLGLSPDRPSLGTLLESARGEVLLGGWWTLVFPAALLVIVTLCTAAIGADMQRRFAPAFSPEETPR